MNISAGFIKRPVATAMLMVGLLLLGLAAYPLLPVAALPNVNYPTIQVSAQLPGADPQTMASSVATPLEEQFGQIPGITQMTSSSALGFTQISLQFDLSRTVDSAATDTLAAINAAGGQLPPAMIYPPTIRKVNPADTPILVLAVTSDTLPLTVVDAYAENILLPKISQISGVGLVGIGGQQKPAIRVQVDPQALAARGIGLEDVRTVLSQANVDLPKGTLNSPRQTYTLNTNDQLLNPKAYNDADRRLPQWLARAHPGYRQGDRRSGKRPAGRLVQSESRRDPGHSTPARRQCRRHGRSDQGPAAAAGGLHPAGHQGIDPLRPHPDHPRLDQRCPVHADADRGPRGHGHLPVPAQSLGDGHPRDHRAAIAGRHLRRALRARLQPRQSLLDGLDDRRRLRRRRCRGGHREHRAPSGGGRDAASGRPAGRRRDRLHHPLHDLVADRRLHPAVPDERLCRAAVPRVRRHRERRSPPVSRHFPDPDAHDVRAAAPQGGEDGTDGSTACWSGDSTGFSASTSAASRWRFATASSP